MIPTVRQGICVILCALPATLNAGGQIRSGEHPGFSRLVLNTGSATQWNVSVSGRTVSLFFPYATERFQTDRIFDLIPKTRVGSVETETGPDGTMVRLEMECDCRVTTLDAGANYLAIDIADPGAELLANAEVHNDGTFPGDNQNINVGSDPDQPLREEKMVSNAEIALIEQIQKAADQGLINLDQTGKSMTENGSEKAPNIAVELSRLSPAVPPVQPAIPPHPPQPTLPLSSGGGGTEESEDTLAMLFDSSQIQASTVFDRYSARNAERMTERATPLDCIPDHQIDVAYWTDGRELFEQASELYGQLVGEFDTPNTDAVLELSQLYIRFGFGAEARNVLTAFEVDTPKSALLNDLSRIVDGGHVGLFGPLARTSACPGRHGLWLAVAGAAPSFHNPEHFETVVSAFSDLPPDLRMLVGPRLIENLLLANHVEQARQIYDIIIRSGAEADDGLRVAEALLVAREGNPAIAIQALSDLIENNGGHLISALKHAVGIAVEANYPIPDRLDTDIRASLLLYRGSEQEPELRRLLALSLAGKGQLEESVTEITQAIEQGEEIGKLDAAIQRILTTASPERNGAVAYANVMLNADHLLEQIPEGDMTREVIAGHLIELGLPGPAEKIVLPAAGRSVQGRFLLGKALIAQGKTEQAHQVASELPAMEAAEINARAFEADGKFAEAQQALAAAGRTTEAASLAWRSGDWPQVVSDATNPGNTPMAEFMASRSNTSEAALASETPDALNPAAAFVEPLPRLDEASLDSTRRLLATSGQLQEFIETLLRPE